MSAMTGNGTYFYALDTDGPNNVTLNVTVYISTCRFWNVTTLQWEGTGCRPSDKSTRQLIVCSCNHLTSFGSNINISPNKLDFSVLQVCNSTLFFCHHSIFFNFRFFLNLFFQPNSKDKQIKKYGDKIEFTIHFNAVKK